MAKNNVGFCREVEDELSARKSRSARIHKQNLEMLKREHPDILAIYESIADTAIDFADKIVASPQDGEALRKLASDIIASKTADFKKALSAAGLDPELLEPVYKCSLCKDTGLVGGEMCGCIRQIVIEKNFSGSGVDPEMSFENFRHDLIDEPRERKANENIYSFCLDYADSFPDNALPDMLLLGAPGVGKTYLLNCIGDRVLKNGYSVLKISANKLVGRVLDSIRDRELERPDFVLPDLLIIDDLGAEPLLENITVETLLSILCERQEERKATVIASNLEPAALNEYYGERIVSRLIDINRSKVIKITTPSLRRIRF